MRKHLVAITLFTAFCLFGQTNRGAITGTITDQSGSVIPGANIVITNLGTNEVRKLTSADHIDGGAGHNALSFFLDTTLNDVDLTNVSNVQEIKLYGDIEFGVGAGSTLTLGAEAEDAGIGKVESGGWLIQHVADTAQV